MWRGRCFLCGLPGWLWSLIAWTAAIPIAVLLVNLMRGGAVVLWDGSRCYRCFDCVGGSIGNSPADAREKRALSRAVLLCDSTGDARLDADALITLDRRRRVGQVLDKTALAVVITAIPANGGQDRPVPTMATAPMENASTPSPLIRPQMPLFALLTMCIPEWYRSGMSTQIAIRLSDDMVAFIDDLVRTGDAGSRAAVVSRALERERRRKAAERDAAILSRQQPDLGLDGLAEFAAAIPLDDLD